MQKYRTRRIEILKVITSLLCFLSVIPLFITDKVFSRFGFLVFTIYILILTYAIAKLGYKDLMRLVSDSVPPSDKKFLKRYRNSILRQAINVVCLIGACVYIISNIICFYHILAVIYEFELKQMAWIPYLVIVGTIDTFIFENIRQSCKESDTIEKLLKVT